MSSSDPRLAGEREPVHEQGEIAAKIRLPLKCQPLVSRGGLRFIKNGVSNLIAGGASAIMAIVLPYYFVRDFAHDEFSLWVLILQLAAYVNYLNFGVQTAIGRYVAHYLGLHDQREAENVLAAGIQILSALAFVGLLIIVATMWLLPVIFPKIDINLIQTGRYMLLWIGGALALGLPFSAYPGVFVGLQRNEIPALISLIAKGGLAIALIAAAVRTHDLRFVSRVYFFVSLAGFGVQYLAFRLSCPDWRLRFMPQLARVRKELISYCASLSIWYVAMLFVSGLDTVIVGIFNYDAVAAYGVATNVTTFFLGVSRSILSPLLQIYTKRHARQETAKLLTLFEVSSLLTSVALLVTSCWLALFAPLLFRLWVGPRLAATSVSIFIVLLFANAIRNSSVPFANYLLATGKQADIYFSQCAEAGSNLVISVAGAKTIGAIGVAWGTFLGAIVLVASNFWYAFRRTMPLQFSGRRYFFISIGKPLLAALPMLLLLWLCNELRLCLGLSAALMLIATLPSTVLAWRQYRAACD